MANFCALCGSKLPFFGSESLVCANQDELFCSPCSEKIYPMDNAERGRYLLEHGKPTNPDAMQEFLQKFEERRARKAKLEPPTRPCPNCGAGMECKIRDFRIGTNGNSLFGDSYDVDLYACPDCGKVELYTANFAAVQAEKARREMQAEQAAEKAAEQESAPVEQEFISYRPGQNTGNKPPWEK